MAQQRKPLFKNENTIVANCEAINSGAYRGEIFDCLDEIEEVFFELYEKIVKDKEDFEAKVEAEKQAQALLDLTNISKESLR